MRNVIFSINLTLDGCCDHTKGNAYEDVHEYYVNLLRNIDVMAFGRITYQLMVPFWPDVAKDRSSPTQAINDFADAFNAVENIVVFSRTLDKPEGKNTRIVSTDLKEEIIRLKQQPGKDILVGGVDIPTQLTQLGLVDEYLFIVQPTFAGEGRRLFDGLNLPESLQLSLVETKTLESGCIVLRYLKG